MAEDIQKTLDERGKLIFILQLLGLLGMGVPHLPIYYRD